MRLSTVSIKWQLMVACILLVALPVITVGSLIYHYLKQDTFEQIEKDLEQQVLLIQRNIQSVYEVAKESQSEDMTEKEYQEILIDSLSKVVVGKDGYVYILDGSQGETLGNYILSCRRERDGENLWNIKDASGNLFIQDMINNTRTLADGKSYTIYYPWIDKGKKDSRMKIAVCVNFPEWNWVIGASAYHEDFMDSLKMVKSLTIVVSLVFILIGSLFAYFFAIRISRPLDYMIKVFETVASGDLRERVNLKSSIPELNSLCISFDKMIFTMEGVMGEITTQSQTLMNASQELSGIAMELANSAEEMSNQATTVAAGAEYELRCRSGRRNECQYGSCCRCR